MTTHRSYKFQLKIGERKGCFSPYPTATQTRLLARILSRSRKWLVILRESFRPLRLFPPRKGPRSRLFTLDSSAIRYSRRRRRRPSKLHPGIASKTDTLLSSRRAFYLLSAVTPTDRSIRATFRPRLANTWCVKRVFIATRNRIPDPRPRRIRKLVF